MSHVDVHNNVGYKQDVAHVNRIGGNDNAGSSMLNVSIGSSYLVGKVLIERGGKVAFDGDPKKYITFKHGMNRVISTYQSWKEDRIYRDETLEPRDRDETS